MTFDPLVFNSINIGVLSEMTVHESLKKSGMRHTLAILDTGFVEVDLYK